MSREVTGFQRCNSGEKTVRLSVVTSGVKDPLSDHHYCISFMTKEQVTSKAVSHLKITKAAADQFLWRFVVLRALRVSHKGWKRISSVGKSSDVLIPGYWLERLWLLCCQKARMDSWCWWFNSGASLRKEQQLGNKYWFYYQLSANKFCNIQLVTLPRGPQMMVFLPFFSPLLAAVTSTASFAVFSSVF